MTCEELNALGVGTKVKLFDRWMGATIRNPEGHMDKYLGQVVTLSYISDSGSYFRIREDAADPQTWIWDCDQIERVVSDDTPTFFDFEAEPDTMEIQFDPQSVESLFE